MQPEPWLATKARGSLALGEGATPSGKYPRAKAGCLPGSLPSQAATLPPKGERQADLPSLGLGLWGGRFPICKME